MKMRPFELALVIVFIVLGFVALAVMAGYDGGSNSPEDGPAITGSVEIWGTMPAKGINSLLESYVEQYDGYKSVSYRYINPANFESTLVNALADMAGPDLLLISQEELVSVRHRILPETYEAFPFRDVRNLYVDGAAIFALQDGLHARPVAVDPLVLFWNRDILSTKGYLAPPRTWEELINVQFEDLIDRGFDRTINRSVVAMGEYGNVRNSFGILSLLLIQGGSAGVTESGSSYNVALDTSVAGGRPLRSALDFYTRFGRPDNTLYSWNRALREDRQAFVSEDLVFYFGYASEGPEIERLNPNLNFDIAEVPQSETSSVRRTYGRFYGMTIMRTTDNYPGAQVILGQLSAAAAADAIAIDSGMAPATRATVAAGSNSTYGRFSYGSAAVAYGWLSPNYAATDAAFSTMVQDVNENRRTTDESVRDALSRLQVAY